MAGVQARRAFRTLDGLRGVGAFLVVMRHVPYFFGPLRVPESFLAVDLFYLVSGFVVAHAYGDRLKAGGFLWDFAKTRLIRLYPLYAIGLAIGVCAALNAVVHDPAGWWTWPKLGEAIVAGLLMIPAFPGLSANGGALDGPTWTLLPELIANVVYAAAIRFMNYWVLGAILVVCGAGLVGAELAYGTLDVGYSADDGWAALARVGFSFFMGVLLFRVFGDRKVDSEWAAWACVIVLAAALAYRPSEAVTPYYEVGMVLVGFPALLVFAGRYEPGAVTGRVFSVVGLVSYGVYILHQPMGNLARDLLKRFVHVPGNWRALGFGVVFLAVTFALAWWLDGAYDAPVRKVLRARFLPDRRRLATA
ncbi:MAG: acyltransferase [Caulobacteraceae bacterium]|nr:acyltransferase [Caulobacteraceae bacterium]